MVRPLNGPAPTFCTNINPANTATAPVMPPSGAHQGMAATVAAFGSGRGMIANRAANTNTIRAKEIVAASQGLLIDLLSWPFIELPAACNTPAIRMNG